MLPPLPLDLEPGREAALALVGTETGEEEAIAILFSNVKLKVNDPLPKRMNL